jgi:hypothetical protein
MDSFDRGCYAAGWTLEPAVMIGIGCPHDRCDGGTVLGGPHGCSHRRVRTHPGVLSISAVMLVRKSWGTVSCSDAPNTSSQLARCRGSSRSNDHLAVSDGVDAEFRQDGLAGDRRRPVVGVTGQADRSLGDSVARLASEAHNLVEQRMHGAECRSFEVSMHLLSRSSTRWSAVTTPAVWAGCRPGRGHSRASLITSECNHKCNHCGCALYRAKT